MAKWIFCGIEVLQIAGFFFLTNLKGVDLQIYISASNLSVMFFTWTVRYIVYSEHDYYYFMFWQETETEQLHVIPTILRASLKLKSGICLAYTLRKALREPMQ